MHDQLQLANKNVARLEKITLPCDTVVSTDITDTTLQLDYALQSVLDKEGVDKEFKKKVRELKKEVEERKNSTWP